MRYLFFVSWLRAREKKIADRTDIDRMIGASILEESFKVLNDTDYAPFISNKNYEDIEDIIEEERGDLRRTFERLGLEKSASEFIFLKDDLILLSGYLKEKFFGKGEKKENALTKKYPEIIKEVEKRSFNSPEEIDDYIIEDYFQKAINFCRKIKEKEASGFLRNYWQKIKISKGNPEERDGVLVEMEDKIIEKSRECISGILPILSFFIKKRRAEYFIRTVFSAKRIGLNISETPDLINKKRTI
ncbi:MAG: hypothetical protein FJZ07_02020 [Candidatus Nealsonbacteria bacterium]|nr:hypothetical protein [Candidatus Nealsonbacteria bacterium]